MESEHVRAKIQTHFQSQTQEVGSGSGIVCFMCAFPFRDRTQYSVCTVEHFEAFKLGFVKTVCIYVSVYVCRWGDESERVREKMTKKPSTQPVGIGYPGYSFARIIYRLYERYHQNFHVQNFTNLALLKKYKTLINVSTYACI